MAEETPLPSAVEPKLADMGWRQCFQAQLDLDEIETARPARVIAVHRTDLVLWSETVEVRLPLGGRWFQGGPEERPTVGDWVLLNARGDAIERLLERFSLFRRAAPGGRGEVQVMAANVDVLFVVSSCNEEFNVARIERYLALALDAGAVPVIVLTKADAAADPQPFLEAARALDAEDVIAVNGLDAESVEPLRSWISRGQTVALVGSSGVGKSTLLNALAGQTLADTGAIREADAKGRHTTTHRALHRLPGGGLVLDSPGMREIALPDVEIGVGEAFDDIASLASRCRFSNCGHDTEPGCAVRAALAAGTIDERRLASYAKLMREQAYAAETIAERHSRVRRFGRLVRRAVELKGGGRGGRPDASEE